MKVSTQVKRPNRNSAKITEAEVCDDLRDLIAPGPVKVSSIKRPVEKVRRASRDSLEHLDSILGLASFLREIEWKPINPLKLTRAGTHVAIAQYIARQANGVRSPSTMSSVS